LRHGILLTADKFHYILLFALEGLQALDFSFPAL